MTIATIEDAEQAQQAQDEGMTAEQRRVAELMEEAQAWLDRCRADEIPMNYPALVAEAYRLYIANLIHDGVLREDRATLALLAHQTALLRDHYTLGLQTREEATLKTGGRGRPKLKLVPPPTPKPAQRPKRPSRRRR